MAHETTGHRLSVSLDVVLKVMVIATLLYMAVTITFVDVIGRCVFNAPVPVAFEVQQLGMGILVFSGLPLVTRDRSHITVSLFDSLFERNGTVEALKSNLVHVTSAGILLFVTYCLSRQAMYVQKWASVSVFLQLHLHPMAG